MAHCILQAFQWKFSSNDFAELSTQLQLFYFLSQGNGNDDCLIGPCKESNDNVDVYALVELHGALRATFTDIYLTTLSRISLEENIESMSL